MENPVLESKVRTGNANLPVSRRILKACEPLYEYAWFIGRMGLRVPAKPAEGGRMR